MTSVITIEKNRSYFRYMIDEALLLEYGAEEIAYKKGQEVFEVGHLAQYYFQIKSGKAKMNNFNDEGREFVQGIFGEGDSFGEPPLFGEFRYPAGAQVMSDSKLIVLPRENFHKLLEEHAGIALSFTKIFADRLHFKSTIAAEMSTQDSGHRILALIDFLKMHVDKLETHQKYPVDLTRQQIADLTGLRVETVIRTLKKLEIDGQLAIIDRKVWR